MLLAHTVILTWLAITGLLVTALLLPLLVGQPFLRAYLLAEHAGCEEKSGDMLANTRTLRPSRRSLPFPEYAVPHRASQLSAVPFHALPRLLRFMRDDVCHLEPGYLSFHREFSGRLSPPSRKG